MNYPKLDRGDLFTCAQCGKEFRAGRSQAEVETEYERNFPGIEDVIEVVCDDCYNIITSWMPIPEWIANQED